MGHAHLSADIWESRGGRSQFTFAKQAPKGGPEEAHLEGVNGLWIHQAWVLWMHVVALY